VRKRLRVPFWARNGASKEEIKDRIEQHFEYNLNRTIAEIRPNYRFDVTCQGSVPESIIAFLDSHDVESAIRLGISLNGDSDTIACMAGGIAQAFYKEIPKTIYTEVLKRLPKEFIKVLSVFEEEFQVNYKLI